MAKSITVEKIAKDLNLAVVAGSKGLQRKVTVDMLSRPGVEFAGFLDFYDKVAFYLLVLKNLAFKTLDIKTQN